MNSGEQQVFIQNLRTAKCHGFVDIVAMVITNAHHCCALSSTCATTALESIFYFTPRNNRFNVCLQITVKCSNSIFLCYIYSQLMVPPVIINTHVCTFLNCLFCFPQKVDFRALQLVCLRCMPKTKYYHFFLIFL